MLVVAALSSVALGAQGIDERFPKADLDEVPDKYREWVTAEVGYLITEDEFDAFLRLDSEAKYERFVEEFWAVRDPTPGTPENEYHDLHYERLAYVNRVFGRSSPHPGWRTDRGRVYLTVGKPQMINRVPSEMLVNPVEVWFYAANPEMGLPPFFYVMFYQRYSAGDFRLYSPLSDGPEKLLNGAGLREMEQRMDRFAQQPGRGFAPTGFGATAEAIQSILIEVDPDLASAAFSYLPSEAGMEFGVTPLSSEMLLADIERVKERIMPDATWAYNVLTGVTDSDVRFETLDMVMTAVPLIDVDGEPFIHFATRTTGDQLNVGQYEERYYFSFKAAGSIVDAESRVLRNFDASMSGDLEPEQARRFSGNPFIYMDLATAIPGRQRFSLMLENTVAHSFGRGEVEIEVPRTRPPEPRIAGPVLALDVRTQESYDPFGGRFPFQYGDLVMVPSVDGAFDAGSAIHVFEQILLPADFGGSVTARYALTDASRATVAEDVAVLSAGTADEHGVLAQVWTIATTGLEPGEYRLTLTLDENPAISVSERVRVRPAPEDPGRPFINAQSAPPPIDVEVALERADLYRIAEDLPKAIEWLAYARDREPDDPEVRARYVELLEETGRYGTLVEDLTPIVAAEPQNTDFILVLARAHARLGQHHDSIRYYERARIALKQDSPEILNPLAAEYHAEGRTEKARELLTLSLELDGDQPAVRRMLERVSSSGEVSATRRRP